MDDKKCTFCKVKKDKSCFGFKNKKLGKLQSRCRECQAEYHREHYLANKKYYLDKSKKSNKNYVARNLNFVKNYKSKLGCKSCGEKCYACLDFHHEDPTKKVANKKDDITPVIHTDDVLVTVWVGNNNGDPMNPNLTSGITGAAPIWRRVMEKIVGNNFFNKQLYVPETVEKKICYFGRVEYFVQGTAQKTNCFVYRPTPSQKKE